MSYALMNVDLEISCTQDLNQGNFIKLLKYIFQWEIFNRCKEHATVVILMVNMVKQPLFYQIKQLILNACVYALG